MLDMPLVELVTKAVILVGRRRCLYMLFVRASEPDWGWLSMPSRKPRTSCSTKPLEPLSVPSTEIRKEGDDKVR